MQECNKTPNSIGSVWLKALGKKRQTLSSRVRAAVGKKPNAYFTGVRAKILTVGYINNVKKFSSTKRK
jgi:hypothetical protein